MEIGPQNNKTDDDDGGGGKVREEAWPYIGHVY